jgi:DNA-binding protein H-NS
LLVGILLFIIIHQRTKQKEMRLLQDQQKANEEIYQLIQNQQTKIDEGRQIEKKRIAQDLHDGIMNRSLARQDGPSESHSNRRIRLPEAWKRGRCPSRFSWAQAGP